MPKAEGIRPNPSRRCGCEYCREKQPEPQRRATANHTGTWQARWYDAAGKRQALTRETKGAAKKAMDAARGEVVSGTFIDPERGKIRLTAWHKKWLAGRNKEDTTNANVDSHWRVHVQPRFGDYPLAALQNMHSDIQAWVVEMERAGLAAETVSHIHNVLDMLLAAAYRDRRIHFNPCDAIEFKPAAPRHPDDERPPTLDQVTSTVARIYHPCYRQLPLLACETGLRWGELAGLLPDAVNLAEGYLTVRRVMIEVKGRLELRDYPKTSASYRMVPLSAAGSAVIERQYQVQPPVKGEPIFRGPDLAWLRRKFNERIWLPAAELAGVHRAMQRPSGRMEHWPTIHDLRHLFASRLENAGVPESTRKYVLGHKRPAKKDITWRYTHPAEWQRMLAEVLRALGDEVDEEKELPPPRRLRLVV